MRFVWLAPIVGVLAFAFYGLPYVLGPTPVDAPPAAVIDCDGMPKRPPVVIKPKVTE